MFSFLQKQKIARCSIERRAIEILDGRKIRNTTIKRGGGTSGGTFAAKGLEQSQFPQIVLKKTIFQKKWGVRHFVIGL